jgi:hypothetical protein
MEHHGDKAASSGGDGGHAKGKEHKTMVGTRDDPSIFILPNVRVMSLLPRLGPPTHNLVPAPATMSSCHDVVLAPTMLFTLNVPKVVSGMEVSGGMCPPLATSK